MPIYEYQCEGCGEVFEVRQKFADEPLKIHEKCGAPVHRLLSAPAFQFKGSGWYVTDYAKSGSSSPKSESKSETKNDSKGEAKSDSKPAESSTSSTTTTTTESSTK